MREIKAKLSADLILRLLVIHVAIQLACAWLQTFQAPWPLENAFELAGSFEEQLFQSLGISLSGLKGALNYKPLLPLIANRSLDVASHQKQILLTINFPAHCDLPSSPIQGRCSCSVVR